MERRRSRIMLAKQGPRTCTRPTLARAAGAAAGGATPARGVSVYTRNYNKGSARKQRAGEHVLAGRLTAGRRPPNPPVCKIFI
ncbi:hypothetical protein EVAR_54412_1 [Eumeta japonica]|uniref:Uncharacterized protein n=1 Tax=Eumeta variegata TaxID=151549 RepID=A0A4C1Y4Y3_EUMVA|nr:hypothetical protein EVAR_54412_1 [Eumeta japonica]